MNTHRFIILILYALIFTPYSVVTASSLEKIENNVTKNKHITTLVEEVERELTQHTWEVEAKVFLFSKTGIVSELKNRDQVSTKLWEVYAENGQAYLKLFTPNKASIYLLGGINRRKWREVSTEKAFNVTATPIKTTGAIANTMYKLTGTWSSTVYSSDLTQDLTKERAKSVKSASFRYHIRQDGTFQKTIYLNGSLYQEIAGVWQITKNAEYIIFHFDKDDGEFQTYIAAIKHLSLDELVLDQALVSCDLEVQLCGQKDTFFFNRT